LTPSIWDNSTLSFVAFATVISMSYLPYSEYKLCIDSSIDANRMLEGLVVDVINRAVSRADY